MNINYRHIHPALLALCSLVVIGACTEGGRAVDQQADNGRYAAERERSQAAAETLRQRLVRFQTDR